MNIFAFHVILELLSSGLCFSRDLCHSFSLPLFVKSFMVFRMRNLLKYISFHFFWLKLKHVNKICKPYINLQLFSRDLGIRNSLDD